MIPKYSKKYISVVLILTSTLYESSTGQEGDYFPLQVGNKWVYCHTVNFIDEDSTLTDTKDIYTLEIESIQIENGISYYRLSNGLLVRKDENGSIFEFNDRFESIENGEFLVFDFSNRNVSLELSNEYNYYIPYRFFIQQSEGNLFLNKIFLTTHIEI